MGIEDTQFAGTNRFQVLSRLGQGGMGVVYQVLDRERNSRLALKVIRNLEPSYLVRFKREFRLVQDLDHPNLISLGEFIEEHGQWFYTMELVDGLDFLTYVLSTEKGPGEESSTPRFSYFDSRSEATAPMAPALAQPDSWTEEPKGRMQASIDSGYRADEGALRSCLIQVVQGLSALHSVGKVHRDIKPSNVLVTIEERVVILDFGLVVELGNPDQSTSDLAAGTYAYMAPEQFSGEPVTDKADWYSVGVILYEALTGSRPFYGTGPEIMMKKQTREPPAPNLFFEDIPEDLSALCVDLLSIFPEDRPSGPEILQRLGVDQLQDRHEPWLNNAVPNSSSFVGRTTESVVLADALERSLRGQGNTVLVHGESGVGKTALARNFAKRVRREKTEALVLMGRCLQHESVPYKAFDAVFDQLSHWLKRLPTAEASGFLPRNASLLARAFPVLQCVKAVAESPEGPGEVLDPQELRLRVFRCVRELFDRISERRPVIVVIDDLQWADSDSLAMLNELMHLPEPPPILLVGTVRSNEETRGATLFDFLNFGEYQVLELQPLSQEESRDLAERLIEDTQSGLEKYLEAIAKESGGHPLFIDTLVRYFAMDNAGKMAGLEDALRTRISWLGSDERRLLELTAIAGFPISQGVLGDAAGMKANQFAKTIKRLRTARLVRTTGQRYSDFVETYHDRIREAITEGFDPCRRQEIHLQLAQALQASGSADPEKLCTHWHGARVREETVRSAARAGERASAALAFDRATEFFHLAFGLGSVPGCDPQEILIKLGDSLANAGKGAEAATIYRFAAISGDPVRALDLKRRSAEQLLISGRYDKGMVAFREVFHALGLRFPKTPLGAWFSLIRMRLWLAIRGYGFRLRSEGEITDLERMQVDACWAAAKGLVATDVIRGQVLQTRGLLLALECGDAYRIARSLAIGISSLRIERPRAVKLFSKLFEQADLLAEECGHPHAKAMVLFSRAMVAYLGGRRDTAKIYFEESEKIFRTECRDVAWELSTITSLSLDAMAWTGRWTEICMRAPRACREAHERGDLYTETLCRVLGGSFVFLINDSPGEARAQVERAVHTWTTQGYHVQHALHSRHLALIDLYEGHGEEALRRVEECWPKLQRAMLLRVPVMRATFLRLRASCYLAAAVDDLVRREEYLRKAARDAKRLAKQEMLWAEPMAELILAGVAMLEGDRDQAVQLLKTAAEGLEREGLDGFAAVCRRRRGQLIGGEIGATLAERAEGWLFTQSVINPAGMTRMLAPGFPEDHFEPLES